MKNKVTKLDQPVELFEKDVWVENGFFYLSKTGRPATGRLTHYNDNGNVAIRLNVQRGLLHGLWEEFFENGDISYWCNFSNGKRDFYDESYDEYGWLTSSNCWLDDELHGTRKSWIKGRLDREEEYRHGKRHGLTQRFGLPLVTRFRGRYVDGEPHGWHVSRYDNNQTKKEYHWDKGVRTDRWRTFYECGQLEYEYFYENGVFSGECRCYFNNGVLSWFCNFKDGKIDGTVFCYHSDGSLRRTIDHKDGLPNGKERHYDNYLNLHRELSWDKGRVLTDLHHIFGKKPE